MKKRGMSHVEVILAFVMFVAAVSFALFIFSPGGGDRIVDSSLEYAFREIRENASVEIETFSVVLDPAGIGVAQEIALSIAGTEGNSMARTRDGAVVSSMKSGDLVYLHRNSWAGVEFIEISFSEEFQAGSVDPVEVDEDFYEIGSSRKEMVVSERKFIELSDSYDENYENLKGRSGFNLPERVEFGFALEFDDGTEIKAEKEVPTGLEIFLDTQRVEVIRTDGRVEFADMTVKVW